MKQGAEDHAKMKVLARLLKIPLPYANGIMMRLWAKAALFKPNGAIGEWSNVEIAEACGVPVEFDTDLLVEKITEARLLDAAPLPCRLIIHDWFEHCEHYTHSKLARREERFASGEIPNLTRLSDRHRKVAEKFFGVSAHGGQISAHGGQISAHGGQISAHGENPGSPKDLVVSAYEGQISAHAALTERPNARARPTPTPTPTPNTGVRNGSSVLGSAVDSKKSAAAASNGVHVNGSKWPLAAEFLTNKFPRTEPGFTNTLAGLAIDAITQAGGNPNKFTDESFREALKQSTFPKQQSAAGYKKTLPILVANWSRK